MAGKTDPGDAPQAGRRSDSNGVVKMKTPSGGIYEGTVLDGEPHGRGRMDYENGSVYQGDWQYGECRGQGTMKLANGAEYVGDWAGYEYHGRGRMRYADGGVYEGWWKEGFKDDLKHGEGACKYADGGEYEGEWENDEHHGDGKKIFDDGDIFDGEWRAGKMHGKGTLKSTDGSRYKGSFRDDAYHGKGTFTYADGDTYEGEWACGQEHGKGTHKGVDGSSYIGEWQNGKHHGKGKIIRGNGDRYEGGWREGKTHGKGTFKGANGDCYQGEWLNGYMHGMGSLKYADGGVYDGQFASGEYSGWGTTTLFNGDKYKGEWKADKKHGAGTYTYVDGSFYDGDWRNDKPHGVGKKVSADGTIYEGEYKDGLTHGMGTFKYAAGEVYEGQWANGVKHGFGTYRWQNGSVYEGEWRGGDPHTDGFQDGEWRDDPRVFSPRREKIRQTLASVLLKDDAAIDGIDDKFVSHLADLVHENGLSKQTNHSKEDILRPWLKGFSFDSNLAKECSDAVMASIDDAASDSSRAGETDVMFLGVIDENDNTKERYALLGSNPFEAFLKNYATSRGATVRRFKHKGRTVFLSSIGKKSPNELGLSDGDEVRVVAISTEATATTKEKESKPQPQTPKGKSKKKHKKSNRKKSMPALPPESTEEKLKEQHSQALSRVFEEADTQFRDIRQRLAAINLQRTMPKQRKSQPKVKPEAAETINGNPPTDGLGGKAGKSSFVVLVGEASNLYNTRAKPSNGNKQSSCRIAGEVDLHGCTKEEALAELDERLPEWMDIAMKGEYPWVISVRIVCGGGTQTLAEAVEGWIKRNPNVSNAPKNIY
ncbi:hypothetical protein ACHAXT_005966 [Thalassiosira profunda]